MAKKGMRAYGALALVGLLLGMTLDPDDDDFGRINIKPDSPLAKAIPDAKDTHIDILAGLDVPAQLTFRSLGGVLKSLVNQDPAYLQDAMQANWRDVAISKQGEPRFLRGKLSPGFSLGADAYTGKDFIGRPFTWYGGLTTRAIPLPWQQAYDSMLYDRYQSMGKEPLSWGLAKEKMDNEKKYGNAALTLVLSFLGAGVTQYPKDSNSKALQLASQLSSQVSKKDDEVRRTEGALRNMLKSKMELVAKGEDTKSVDREIQRHMSRHPELQKQLNKINGQVKGTAGLMSYYIAGINDEGDLNRILKLTTDEDEKAVIEKRLKTLTKGRK